MSAGALIIWALALLLLPLKWVVAIFLAASVHEGAHLLTLWLLDIPIHGIQIGPWGMKLSVAYMEPACELAAASAGPLLSDISLLQPPTVFPPYSKESLYE